MHPADDWLWSLLIHKAKAKINQMMQDPCVTLESITDAAEQIGNLNGRFAAEGLKPRAVK